jgi:hypothetical protein
VKVSGGGQSKRFLRCKDGQCLRTAFEEASAAIRALGLGVIAATAAIAGHPVMLRFVTVWQSALIRSHTRSRMDSLHGQRRAHRCCGQRESYDDRDECAERG